MAAVRRALVTLKDGRTRRYRSKQERRQIVEEAMKPGASVSAVARAYDVNTNQVFKWRREYQQGRLEEDVSTPLLPVKIAETIPAVPTASRRKTKHKASGMIDIDLGHARVRVEGRADPDCVRAALESLLR